MLNEPKKIKIANIVLISEVQSRMAMDARAIEDYTEALENGDEFPPVHVFDTPTGFVLADGWHRLEAHKRVGREWIRAIAPKGTVADAAWYAAQSNRDHGVRRTSNDKRRAIKLAIANPRAAKMSNRKLAKVLGVSEGLVRRVKSGDPTDSAPPEEKSKPQAVQEAPKEAPSAPQEGREPTLALAPSEPDEAPQGQPRAAEEPAEPIEAPADGDKPDLGEIRHRVNEDIQALKTITDRYAQSGLVDAPSFTADMANATQALRDFARPAGYCPVCDGLGCEGCRQRGWVGTAAMKLLQSKAG